MTEVDFTPWYSPRRQASAGRRLAPCRPARRGGFVSKQLLVQYWMFNVFFRSTTVCYWCVVIHKSMSENLVEIVSRNSQIPKCTFTRCFIDALVIQIKMFAFNFDSICFMSAWHIIKYFSFTSLHYITSYLNHKCIKKIWV